MDDGEPDTALLALASRRRTWLHTKRTSHQVSRAARGRDELDRCDVIAARRGVSGLGMPGLTSRGEPRSSLLPERREAHGSRRLGAVRWRGSH
jgi:hypothetical protein